MQIINAIRRRPGRIVVDDNIDPTRINDVVWALSTGCDPETGIDLQPRCWSSSLDPMIHPDSKVWLNSRAVIEAYRPYEWRDKFPEVVIFHCAPKSVWPQPESVV